LFPNSAYPTVIVFSYSFNKNVAMQKIKNIIMLYVVCS